MIRHKGSFSAATARGGFELFGAGKITSIQRGTSVVQPGQAGITVPISPVDLSKAVLVFSSRTTVSNNEIRNVVFSGVLHENQIEFLNNETLGEKHIEWEVIEFEGVHVQRGTYAGPFNNGVLINISPIDVNKSFVLGSFHTNATTVAIVPTFRIVDSSTIEVRNYSANSLVWVAWQVVEFLQ